MSSKVYGPHVQGCMHPQDSRPILLIHRQTRLLFDSSFEVGNLQIG